MDMLHPLLASDAARDEERANERAEHEAANASREAQLRTQVLPLTNPPPLHQQQRAYLHALPPANLASQITVIGHPGAANSPAGVLTVIEREKQTASR